jgi:hypothetical protein
MFNNHMHLRNGIKRRNITNIFLGWPQPSPLTFRNAASQKMELAVIEWRREDDSLRADSSNISIHVFCLGAFLCDRFKLLRLTHFGFLVALHNRRWFPCLFMRLNRSRGPPLQGPSMHTKRISIMSSKAGPRTQPLQRG